VTVDARFCGDRPTMVIEPGEPVQRASYAGHFAPYDSNLWLIPSLELLTDSLARLRRTDSADTPSHLPAAWRGFRTARAAGGLLARSESVHARARAVTRSRRPARAGVHRGRDP
jgi:hypothetical protein